MSFNTTVNLIGASFFGLVAVLGLVLWIIGIVYGLIHDRRRSLGRKEVSDLVPLAFGTTMSAILAATIFAAGATEQHFITASPGSLVFGEAVVLLAACGLLWLALLYLKLRPKQPLYYYLLPRDANQVRFDACRLGIACMAASYPMEFADHETLDAFVRGSSVGSRIHAFPKGKRGDYQLTNDFGVYCTLAVEGFATGYYGFQSQCQAAPDHLETTRQTLQNWSAKVGEADRLLDTLAHQLMEQDRKGGDAE